jgi:hypothetical protein
MPSNQVPEFKAGFEFINENLRSRLLMNLKSLTIDTSVTYLVRSDLIVGGNLIFDPKNSTLDKYDLGFSWSAGAN